MQNDVMQQIIEQPHDELQSIVRQVVGEGAMPVGALTATKIGRSVGHATMGIFRVEGRAQLRGQERAWSAVVKALGAPEQERNAAGDNLQHAEALRETEIYRARVFADVCGGVRAPHCYAIQLLPACQLLWLEDLSHAPQPPWERHHFLAAARSLGQFNAHWPAHVLPAWEWLNLGSVRAEFTGNPGYQASFAQLAARQEHPLLLVYAPPTQADLLPRLWDECDRLLQQVEATSKGVCHLDCHPKNLFPILSGNGAVGTAYTVAIDWVKVGIANLGIDIGHLLASPITWLEVTLDEAVFLRDAIFDAYVAGLTDEGWSGDVVEVRITYLTRLACEAIRNANLMTRSVNSPAWLTMMERFMGHPIEEIAVHYRDALAFYLACKDEALRLVRA